MPGFTAKMGSEETLQELLNMEEVDYVEEDGPVYAGGIFTQRQPENWGLARLSDRKPLNNTALKNYKYSDKAGQSVRVYVLDTGVDNNHVEFGGRVKLGPSFVESEDNAMDLKGHGTHVAGTVGGIKYGVAKKVSVTAVKVLNQKGQGDVSLIIAGVDYVLSAHKNSKNKRAIVNMSIVGASSPAENDAVTRLYKAGIPVFVCAGNGKTEACTTSMGGYPGAFAVQAIDINDTIASFASYGKCVSIFAPGADIVSACLDKNSKDRVIAWSGCSMATPHVAGLAAVLMSEDVKLKTAEQVYARIRKLTTTGLVKGNLKGSPNLAAFNGVQY